MTQVEDLGSEPVVEARRKGTLGVILGGLVTSALTLAGVWYIAEANAEFNIMGWYAMFVIPAGAIIVGIAAGSGYCFVSWLRGVKITGLLLWSIVALQVLAYAEAQYLEYRTLPKMVLPNGEMLTFPTYFDITTRSMSFQRQGARGAGNPLGVWGYAFRGLELVGFALGGIIPSLMLSAKPFCETCQVYMKSKSQGWLPAGVVPRKVNKKDPAAQQAYEAEAQAAFENGLALTQTAITQATAGDAAGFQQTMDSQKANKKEIEKQTARIEMTLNYCPRCSAGHLKAVCHTGQGDSVSQNDLQVQEVTPEFVRQCVARV